MQNVFAKRRVNFASFCVAWAAALAALFVGERKPKSWQFRVSEREKTREKKLPNGLRSH
jgi:hypothetical protein